MDCALASLARLASVAGAQIRISDRCENCRARAGGRRRAVVKGHRSLGISICLDISGQRLKAGRMTCFVLRRCVDSRLRRRTTVWGNTVGTDTVSATASGSAQSHTVYGRVPPQTSPAPASYTDTITVTVTY